MYQQPEMNPEQAQSPVFQQPIPMQPQQVPQPMYQPGQQVYAQPMPGQVMPQYPQQQVPMQPYPGYAPQPMQQPQYYQQPAPAQPIVIAPVFNNQVSQINGFMVAPPKPTLGMPIRIIYFLFFGWYFGFTWIGFALFFCCTILGLPIGIWMFNRTSKAFFLW